MTQSYDRIAALLEELVTLVDGVVADDMQRNRAAIVTSDIHSRDLVDLVIEGRRLRPAFFDRQLFGEPGWDILLGLYAAHQADRTVSVTAAMTFGETPPTTGLRWLLLLERKGLLSRTGDPGDARRDFVRLSPLAVERIEAYCGSYGEWIDRQASQRKS